MAERYGMGKSYYHQKLQLLELPNKILKCLSARADNITEKHARHICKIFHENDLEKKFVELYQKPRKEWAEEQGERDWCGSGLVEREGIAI